MTLIRPQDWHVLPAEEAMARLAVDDEGLAPEEAERRLREEGPNRLRPPERRTLLRMFLTQFHNVLIYVLLAAGVVTVALGHFVDAGVIFGVVIINAVIGVVQEGKAEKAMDAIRAMLSPTALVVRGGHKYQIPAEDLVPGDIVALQSGDKVPADLRLVHARSLQVQEAALTGESTPVEKALAPVQAEAPLADRVCMAYSGTVVTYGHGRGVVVATGDATELGRVSRMISEVQTLETPLLRQMAVFGRWLTAIILAVAAATFFFGWLLRDYSAGDMFLAAVGLAVAAIPEGLPAVMTITLAIGVQRMARRNAIIRRLPAVETLGAVTVVCSDKTGTLTRNEMAVRSVVAAGEVFDVTGVGYGPEGEIQRDGTPVDLDRHPLLRHLARGGLLCNDSELQERDGVWDVAGDPTEGALLTLAAKAGLDLGHEARVCHRTDAIPFESEHRFMATLHHDHEGHAFIHVKGAPERVLAMCARQAGDDGDEPLDADVWHRRAEDLARQGQRVLALAWRRADDDSLRALTFEDVEGGLTLLGLFGLIDPPRDEAVVAVRKTHAAGIRVKMITGDHAVTAGAVAEQLGLTAARVLTGADLDRLDEAELRTVAAEVDVFARTSPEHKLRLVKALQSGSQVVAMTGDGVNDAPALKRADIGVAMGQKGTEAAKEAAEMVLGDDNFASITHAVEEGRTVYDNLKKAIAFILPTNGGQALTIIAAILVGASLPITPVQILWVNMITAVTLALAMAFEPTEAGAMDRPPRRTDEPLLSRFLVWRIVFVSLLLLAATFGMFLWELEGGAELAMARTVAVNALVAAEIAYLFNCRYLYRTVISREGLLGSRPVLIAVALVVAFQLMWTYLPPLQLLFDTRGIDLASWGRIAAAAAVIFVAIEVEKAVAARLARRR